MGLVIKQWFKQHNYAWKFKLTVCLPIFGVLIPVDWITKGVVVSKMSQGQTADFWPGFLRFNLKINPGAAYGLNSGNLPLAISLATVVTVILILAFILVNDRKWLIALTFLIGGSVANLLARAWAPVDEVTKLAGGVVDFLQWDFLLFHADGYIFNLADLWVIFGLVAFIIALILEIIFIFLPPKKSRHTKNPTRKKEED